jgi:hypothetical protein
MASKSTPTNKTPSNKAATISFIDRLQKEGVDPGSVEPAQVVKKFEMIADAVVETEDRLDDIEDNLKTLFQKTNYEQVKYFKFMND